MVISDWLEYMTFSVLMTVIMGLIHYLTFANADFALKEFVVDSLKAQLIFTITFGALEKIKKEQFIVGFTNSKTKKIVLGILNQSPNPIVLVGKNGQIQYYNSQFETMLGKRLGIKLVPQSIYKLVKDDESSLSKLKNVIEEAIKPQASLSMSNSSEKKLGSPPNSQNYDKGQQRAEIKFAKVKKVCNNGIGKGLLSSKNEAKEESKTGTSSINTAADRTMIQKELFDSKLQQNIKVYRIRDCQCMCGISCFQVSKNCNVDFDYDFRVKGQESIALYSFPVYSKIPDLVQQETAVAIQSTKQR